MKTIKKKIKKWRFPKGVARTYFPFMLSEYIPWQDQIKAETEKIKARYIFGKNVCIGFSIENWKLGQIYLYKWSK